MLLKIYRKSENKDRRGHNGQSRIVSHLVSGGDGGGGGGIIPLVLLSSWDRWDKDAGLSDNASQRDDDDNAAMIHN